MKPKNTFSLRHPVTAGVLMALVLSACQSDRLEVPDRQELYNREFIKKFGISSLDHEWNVAVRVHADIESSLLAKASIVNVYTSWPGNPACAVVASYEAGLASSIEFDYPQGLKKAYVQILDDKGKAIYAQYTPINNGCMAIGSRGSRTEASSAPVYAWNIGENRGLGSVPVDRDHNSDFWGKFITNDGNPLGIKDVNVKYKEYSPLTVKEGADGAGNPEINTENGYTFGTEWNVNAHIDGGLPADMVSNSAVFELTYSTPADLETDVKSQMKWSDHNWTGYQFTGADGLILEPTGGKKRVVEITARGINNLKGNLIRIQGINYTIYSLRFKGATNNVAYINNIFKLYGLAESPVTDFEGYRHNYLKPENTSEAQAYSAGDLVPFVGSTGVFREEINKSDGQCNLEKYRDRLHIDDRMDFIVAEDMSEVSIDYLFGSTSYYNSFGYFYYTDAEANLPEEQRIALLLKKPKFILMYDACPFSNLMSTNPREGYTDWDRLSNGLVAGTASNGDALGIIGPGQGHEEGKNNTWDWNMCKRFADYVTYAEQNPDDTDNIAEFRSAKYRLVYYAPDQFDSHNELKPEATGSYKFPLGTHIAFFVITSGQYIFEKGLDTSMKIDNRRIQFSVPLMNKYMGNTMNHGHSHHAIGGQFDSEMITGGGSPEPWTPFVAYQWNGETIMGVEDGYAETENGLNGSDHDMNDMLLRVNGRFVDDLEELKPDDKPAAQGWIIACEDLGGSLDFDFNDVVFGISHVAGETTARVTALAAGGTLPVFIQSKYPMTGSTDSPDSDGYYTLKPEGSDGEIHRWWNPDNSHSTPINAFAWGGAGKYVTINVPEEFTLTDKAELPGAEGNMGGFRVIVHQPDGKTSAITAPDPDKGTQTPQMFLAPRAWLWPRETQSIDGVYGGFIPWYEKWWETRDGANASNVVLHTWRPIHD